MIVLDASAAAEVLLAGPRAAAIRGALGSHSELHVPEHFHAEVLSVLRRHSLRGRLGDARAAVALRALAELRAVRYPLLALAGPIWDLRPRLSVYDAAYLALARRLGVRLLTLDAGLASLARSEGRLEPIDPPPAG